MATRNLANTTLPILPIVNISIPDINHTVTTTTSTPFIPQTLTPHFPVVPHIPYPHHITDIPRPFPPRDLDAAGAADAANNADAAFPVTTQSQRTEYLGYLVTWITKTQTIFDVDQDGIPDYLTKHVAARDVAAVNIMVNSDGTAAIDKTQNEGINTPNPFAASLFATYPDQTLPPPYPFPFPYPSILKLPGPVIPSTFATVTVATPNPGHINFPRENNVASKSVSKNDITLTAVAWTTFWVPGPDSTRTQERTVTLGTGLVLPTTEVNGQPVVTLEVEGTA